MLHSKRLIKVCLTCSTPGVVWARTRGDFICWLQLFNKWGSRHYILPHENACSKASSCTTAISRTCPKALEHFNPHCCSLGSGMCQGVRQPLESHMPERLIPLVVRPFPTADRCMRSEDPTFVELGARPSQAVESSNRSSRRSCWHSTHDIDRREY